MEQMTPQSPPAQQPQPQQAQPASAEPSDDQLLNAHRRVVAAAMKVVYSSGDMVQDLVNMVRAAPDPVQGITQAARVVLEQLRERVKGINPEFVYSAARQVVIMIAELAVKAGVIPDDMKIVQAAIQAIKQQPGNGEQQPPPPPEQPAPQAAPQGLLGSQIGG